MAFVGSLSGSGGASNTINVTGSIIIANPGTEGLFPAFPGTDAVFFVSGAIDGKAAGSRTVSVFGGDTVVSGSLTIGTGSIRIDSNEIRFQGGAAKITSGSGGLTFFDSGTPSGVTLTTLAAGAGGGDVDGPSASIDNSIARFDGTSGKLLTGSAITISDETGGGITIAGSATATTISLFNTLATTVNFAGGASAATNIGNASGLTTIAGNLQVTGNDIKMSGGTTALTFSGTGDVAVAGDLTVTGGKITLSNGALVDSETAGTLKLTEDLVEVTGDLKVTGNDIQSSTGATAITLSGDSVIIPGDLTVNGTTTTINTTNLLVEDPVIYFGSGSVGVNRNGGIALASGSSVTHQALVWGRVADDTWGAGRLDVTNGTVTNLTTMSLLPVRASKLELGGNTAFVTSSLGTNILAQASTATTLKTTAGDINLDAGTGAGVDILFNGTQAGAFTGTGGTILNLFARDGIAGSVARSLVLSGSDVTIGAHSTVTNFSFAGTNSGLASSTSGFTLGSAAGLDLNLSGSNSFRIRHGSSGVAFQQHGSPYLAIASGSNALSTNLALITGTTGKDLLVGGSSLAILSGSEVFLDAGANGVNVRRDSSTFISFTSGSTNAVSIIAPTSTTANIFNTTVTTLNLGGAATAIEIGAATGTTSINHDLTVDGNTVLGSSSSSKITFTGQAASKLVPDTNNAYDLGEPNLRWRNMYTGDLHLRNERGDWTIIEEEEFLTITNNKNGKRYKFCLEEI